MKLLQMGLFVSAAMLTSFTYAETKKEVLISNSAVALDSEDFEADIMRIPEMDRFEFRSSADRITKVANNLFINRVFAQEAKKAGLDHDPKLQRRIQLYSEAILATAWMEQTLAKVKLPDFEPRARELYKAEPELYTGKLSAHAAHILIDTKKRSDADALKLAKDVLEKARQGEPFEKLAVEYSDDPTAKSNKGDLGFFEPGRMVKPFSDAAFALKKAGELSEPVKTDFGYHIIRLIERKEAKLNDFESVKKDIIEGLKTKYLADIRGKLLGDVQYADDRKVDEAAILRLKTDLTGASKPAAK